MTSDDHHPDLNRRSTPAPSDLDTLSAHPSLTSLRGRGRLLDRLPTGSTAWAFGCALLASFVLYGTTGAAIVNTRTLLTIPVAAYAVASHDLRRARLTLQIARYGLLGLLVGIVALACTISSVSVLDSSGASTPATTSRPASTASSAADQASSQATLYAP